VHPTPVARLNHSAAVALADGPHAGMRWLELWPARKTPLNALFCGVVWPTGCSSPFREGGLRQVRTPEEIDWGPISRVKEGMDVVDVTGDGLGHVELVQMGDPRAATTAGNEDRRPGPIERVAEAMGGEREPEVPEPLRSRLVRSGYVKIDSPDLLDHDRYVPSEYVREVADDCVRLSVRKDDLAKAH
jgi:hypothetical protein